MARRDPMAEQSNDTLYLVDGSGFIFRAYYAIRASMTAVDGTPTNAVYGFVRLLLNLLRDRDPGHVAVAFDPSGGVFRNELYPDYKANRKEPPEDMRPQFALCREAVAALGIPVLIEKGYEADDMIGTLATRWTASGRPCIIVTADKDMMQLVNDQISIWDGKEKEIGRDGVIERFGVPPERVIDVLGLAGDSSDNIPGVPGIGEKTAAKLLEEHGTMDALLAAADQVKGKRGENLREFADQARLSRTLATIVTDAPVTATDEDLKRSAPDPDTLAGYFRRLNFRTFLKEFGLESHAVQQIDRGGYYAVRTSEELKTLVRRIKRDKRLSLDLETTSLSTVDARIVGFALAWDHGRAAYVPVGHTGADAEPQLSFDEVKAALGPIIEDPAFPKFGQNVKYEWQVLWQHGIHYRGYVCDSMLAAYLIDPNRPDYKLDELSQDFLGHKMIAFEEVTGTKGKDADFAAVAVEQATQYAAEDADVALRLCDVFKPKLTEAGLDRINDELELPLAEVIGRMELRGVRIDPDLLRAQSKTFEGRIAAMEAEIHALAEQEFNISSPKQLGEILFEKLGLPVIKSTKTGPSTDAEVLDALAPMHPLPAKIVDYRHLVKLKGTYLDTLPTLINPKTGRVHSSFRQAVAATGRISSIDPNLQNIPVRTTEGREIRRAFITEPGFKLVSADYSQVELRVLAHLAEDPTMIEAFRQGVDIHARTAAEVFGVALADVTAELRRRAKAVNYGLAYGLTGFGLSRQLGISRGEADAIHARYFERFSAVKAYQDRLIEEARRTKQSSTLFGRIRPLPHIDTRKFNDRRAAERLAINTPIQGTAADILKYAMVALDRRLRAEEPEAHLLLTVHEELVVECPAARAEAVAGLLRTEMEGGPPERTSRRGCGDW
ncbi:MAG: DNA polymerase I [bacterium]